MLHLFEANSDLFSSWQVVRYEQEGDAYMLQLKAILEDLLDFLKDWFASARASY
jgi:hypothetical protein